MQPDWALAHFAVGVCVLHTDGEIQVLEFNAFLQQIAAGSVQPEDIVVSRVFTDGHRRRAGDLRLYELVRSGQVRTDDLPLRTPGGLLAEGKAARDFLREIEEAGSPSDGDLDVETLLRAARAPLTIPVGEMLRTDSASADIVLPEKTVDDAHDPNGFRINE